MAELNFNALARSGPQGFTQGFQQADAQMRVDETNRTSQEINRFKLEELKRDRAEMMQLQEQLKGMGQDPDLDKLMDVYARSGRPDYVKMGLEGKQKLKEQREYAKLIGNDMAAPAAPAAAPSVMRMPQAPAPTNALGSGTFGMGKAAPVNALAPSAPAAAAPVNAMAPSPNAGQIQQTQKRIDDLMRFAATNPGMAGQAMSQAKLLQDQLEMFSRAKTPETAKLADRFVPVGRLVFDRETQQYISPSQAQLTQSQERPATSGGGGGAMPKAPSGYRYTPTGDLEAIPGGPAAAGPNLTPKDIQKREAVLPQARQAVSTVSNTMSIIGETVDRLIANKSGLNGVTGLISGRTPGITDAARKAEADLNQLKNLAFIQGITELRAASKTGAGVGNVSNKEGDRFENLKASLERTQSYDDIVAALKRLKSQSEFTKQSLKEAFDETYSYRNAAPDASNAAQERANANAAIAAGAPAAAVRQRFKEKTGQEL
jgi:hypothetical protein